MTQLGEHRLTVMMSPLRPIAKVLESKRTDLSARSWAFRKTQGGKVLLDVGMAIKFYVNSQVDNLLVGLAINGSVLLLGRDFFFVKRSTSTS